MYVLVGVVVIVVAVVAAAGVGVGVGVGVVVVVVVVGSLTRYLQQSVWDFGLGIATPDPEP